MSVESLLDTNIIIYSLGVTASGKHHRAEQLVRAGLEDRSCCISEQVIRETLNVATGKLDYSHRDADRLLSEVLLPLCQIVPMSHLYRRGLDVHSRYRYGFYDSLIIAAALEAGCTTLYSEDLQHGQRIERLTIENPFAG